MDKLFFAIRTNGNKPTKSFSSYYELHDYLIEHRAVLMPVSDYELQPAWNIYEVSNGVCIHLGII